MNALRGVGAPLTKFLIFAVITLLCTGLLGGTIANQVGGGTDDYNARFTDATGVNRGDEIRIAGVRVGQVNDLLAHTATLTSTIADKDKVIGSVIDNLNATLDTINARDTEFTQLVGTVRQLVSGLAKDRDTIGDAVDSLGDLTDATADLLK